jgi:hypothetical protein
VKPDLRPQHETVTAAYVLTQKPMHPLQTAAAAAGRTFAGCNMPSGDPCTSAAVFFKLSDLIYFQFLFRFYFLVSFHFSFSFILFFSFSFYLVFIF